jgi:hypothetical protein
MAENSRLLQPAEFKVCGVLSQVKTEHERKFMVGK